MFNKELEQLLTFIRCIYDIDFKIYDKDGNTDKMDILSQGYIANHLEFANKNVSGPIVSGNESGLQFITVTDDNLNHYVLGPYLMVQLNDNDTEKLLDNKYTFNLSVKERIQLKTILLIYQY